MTEKIIKGIKMCLYPAVEQEEKIWQLFGNTRFVWNQMLAMAKKRYANNPSSKFLDQYKMDLLLTQLKREYPFLKESPNDSLQMVDRRLAQAFKMLFKHQGGYPKFKSRHSAKQAYASRSLCKPLARWRLKISKLGSIKSSKTDCLIAGKIKLYTISLDSTGRYYLSVQLEMDKPKALPKTGRTVGIDVGVADLAISSDGVKYGTFNAKWYESQVLNWQKKYSKRLNQAKIATRQYNHNHKLSEKDINDFKNWQKARKRKALYQQKIASRRKDYLHQLTNQLVKQYDVIVIEDLRIKNLLKNHHLAKAISNASWYEFRTMLQYKCDWYGKKLIVVKPNYTSQICSNCGYHSGPKPLSIREWTCPRCGVHHDRDINAAVNILHKGLKAVG